MIPLLEASEAGQTPVTGRNVVIVREALVRELLTLNQYEEALASASDPAVKALLAHLLFEEKEHVAELVELLKKLDPDQLHHFEAGHAAGTSRTDAHPLGRLAARTTVGSLLGLPQ